MKQSKRKSAIESIANVIIGLIISFLIQLWIYPFLGLKVSINQNIFITFIFFIASFVRGYVIRRIFNNF
jgi:high-affinity Fe2+/Pb2+ permease